MKKISQVSWKRYKESEEGKNVIILFDKFLSVGCSLEDRLAIMKQYNPQCFHNLSDKESQSYLLVLEFFDSLVSEEMEYFDLQASQEEKINFFVHCTYELAEAVLDQELEDGNIPQRVYKLMLNHCMLLSVALSRYMPDFFVPNLFVMQFIVLKRLAQKYEIKLPAVPQRADYEGRWYYYIEMCAQLNAFARENDISVGAELCAFLFDYEMPLIMEELKAETKEMPENAGRAWILVGNYGEGESEMEAGFWQANELTERGDICLFYEKSPVKALTGVWVALQDGVVDPFFHYYSNTYIGHKITIPSEYAIRFRDFKDNIYFQNREKKGNFVSKNFQDVSGWPVTSRDYAEVLRMLEEKGFDVSILPRIYEPRMVGKVEIEHERDVSEQLLIPLLEQMGWKRGVDFREEVEFQAGRGRTNCISAKRPDICLHITERQDDLEAKVAIEVKRHMKTSKEIHRAFVQGRSYAKWGGVEVLLICDMHQIRVYKRDKDYRFDEDRYIKYGWSDMEHPDKYAELKSMLSF